MKWLRVVLLFLGLCSSFYSQVLAQDTPDNDTLFQVSTLGALSEGVYDGALSYEDLQTYGDFGLGTFDKLNGEMVALDGEFYQVTVEGVPQLVDPSLTTPFAAVTFFEPDQILTVGEGLACVDLYNQILAQLPSGNLFYAIKLEGVFSSLTTRSVPPQTEPYPILVDVVAIQTVFELKEVEATLVGFWLPPYMTGLNATGFHFHAITQDKSAGGHVLDCLAVGSVNVSVDVTDQLEMILPDTAGFLEVNLAD